MYKNKKSMFARGWRRALAVACTILAGLLGTPAAFALPQFLSQVPPGYAAGCETCHVQPPVLNDLGKAFKDNGFSFAGLAAPPAPAAPVNTEKSTAPSGSTAPEKGKPHLELLLPAAAVRGEKLELKARLTAGGQPVKGAEVQFFEETEFFLQGRVKLGSARTNEEGIAAIHYWPRAVAEQVRLGAGAAGSDLPAPLEATGVLSLTMAGGPLVEPAEGLDVPFLGLWTVALLIAAVWVVYAYVAYNVLQIPRLGRRAAEAEQPEVQEQERYASL